MASLAYVKLEVGGIQAFICQTGKLKEMIGGSEMINALAGSFYEKIRQQLSLNPVIAPQAGEDWIIEIQNNAGTLCLILPSADTARTFLRTFSMEALRQFPGLPLYGAHTPVSWTRESLSQARVTASNAINHQRARRPVASGMPMLPVAQAARLDGLPAVARDGEERISLLSWARRSPTLLRQSRERLQSLAARAFHDTDLPDVELLWKEDLAEMLGSEKQRVALVHMDGNDLGKRFAEEFRAIENDSPEEGMTRMRKLSAIIQKANEEAFAAALRGILVHELRQKKIPSQLVVPLRPLVMGGDDITVIVRADLCLAFVQLFARAFEEVTRKAGSPLSLGAGLVIMPASYPFVKAFALVDALLESAKHATLSLSPRPSSLDYLVLTSDVETDLSVLRRRTMTSQDGASLTTKPLILEGDTLGRFLNNGRDVLTLLPRSAIRSALNTCRTGVHRAHRDWSKLRENIHRGLGGRRDQKLMGLARFEEIFPGNFFVEEKGMRRTALGDYLELARVLPEQPEARRDMLEYLLDKTRGGTHV